MSSLVVESHQWNASPLQISAKRYTSSSPRPASQSDEVYTLVMLHGAGFLKECWEPVVRQLFTLSESNAGRNFVIDEAWAIDCPNHGEAAVLNADVVSQPPYSDAFETSDWAEGAYKFISTKLAASPNPRRRLIGVGHSIGAVTMLHLAQTHPTFFTSMTLLDPILFPVEFDRQWAGTVSHLVASAYQRRDVWPSRKAAVKDLKGNSMFGSWTAEQIELFVEHGMHEHPGSKYQVPYKGVTLKCTREMEAALYRGGGDLRRSVLQKLAFVTNAVPTYVAFGAINDSVPRKVQDALVDSSKGVNFVQVSRIPNGGHLVVQQQPAACGSAVFDALQHLTNNIVVTPIPEPVVRRRVPAEYHSPGEIVYQAVAASAKL